MPGEDEISDIRRGGPASRLFAQGSPGALQGLQVRALCRLSLRELDQEEEADAKRTRFSNVRHSRGIDMSRSKYSNRKTNGYASAREARRAAELKLMEKAGEIRGLLEQPKYELIPKQCDAQGKVIERACHYVGDFAYFDCKTGQRVVEDSKGFKNRVYLLKRKLLLQRHGIQVRET
jgi:hypothetical protein